MRPSATWYDDDAESEMIARIVDDCMLDDCENKGEMRDVDADVYWYYILRLLAF